MDCKISPAVQALLQCPVCRGRLTNLGESLQCANPACGAGFPIVKGIPVLINEAGSIFSIQDYVSAAAAPAAPPSTPAPPKSLKARVKELLMTLPPGISKNIKGARNYAQFIRLLRARSERPRVLVVGGGIVGQGMDALMLNSALELVETDVILGPRTMLVCDAHDLPFQDGAFDGVIVQAVLEHVVDPYRCVDEIHRVLARDGLVYAETPFMQQVHGGPYDFTRFTHLGHRRLFRKFDEIESGAMCGPGMALAWAYQYFLTSFTTKSSLRLVLRAFSSLTSFFLKYCDAWLIDRPGALDAASGCYFLGRKADHVLSDRELIKLYRGAL